MKHTGGLSRIWREKIASNERFIDDCVRRSPMMSCLGYMGFGAEWRTMLAMNMKTLVRDSEGIVSREGPVVVGIRYNERFLSEAPHPFEIVAVLAPRGIFHPNCDRNAAMCLGHPAPGISMELIVNQVFAGLMFNMKFVNTRPGEIANRDAAMYVRANADQFPITRRGLFENPDDELRNKDWHILFDPQKHSAGLMPFAKENAGGAP